MENKILFQKDSNGPYLYIRHAQSKYNEFVLKEQTEDKAKHMPEFWDAPITKLGESQAGNLSKELAKFKIERVFCSPMRRCMQTTFIALRNHPQKNIKIIIHPLITESVHVFHDFSRHINSKKEEFRVLTQGLENNLQFDWEVFDSIFPEEIERELYYFNYMDNLAKLDENIVLKMIEDIRSNPENTETFVTFNDYNINNKVRPESLKGIFRRNLKFKDHLRQFNPEEENKILVFTHSDFTRMSTSIMAYEMEAIEDFPSDSYKPSNCEIISMKL